MNDKSQAKLVIITTVLACALCFSGLKILQLSNEINHLNNQIIQLYSEVEDITWERNYYYDVLEDLAVYLNVSEEIKPY